MHDSELFGGVLYTATDVIAAASVLADLLKEPTTDRVIATQAGLDATLVDSLRVLELSDPAAIDQACALGAAWVSGRRSIPTGHTWEAVASLPVRLPLLDSLHRTTAETLIGLANKAEIRLRLAAPYMDEQGSRLPYRQHCRSNVEAGSNRTDPTGARETRARVHRFSPPFSTGERRPHPIYAARYHRRRTIPSFEGHDSGWGSSVRGQRKLDRCRA